MDRARSTSATARTGGDEIERLKSLLFRPESQQISSLEAQVDALDRRVGSPDRLEMATAEILVDALRRAEIAQHRELADALAPMVVAAIRNEIRNSKDMMVEALYPITGRLVSAGIALAIAELAASINQRMDSLFSADVLRLRLQSWRTGRPLSELALAQTQSARLVRLLYLERGSGQLVGQWQADHGEDARADLLGGMIAALTDFARNALGEGGGELRNLDLGGRHIYLRTSARMIIAAEFQGELDPRQEKRLDAGFLDLLDAGVDGDAGTVSGVESLAASLCVVEPPKAMRRSSVSPLAMVGVVLSAVLAAWLWFAVQHWRVEQRVQNALAQVVAARPDLAAYPLATFADHAGEAVRLQGLVPSAADRDALEAAVRIAAAPYQVSSTLALVASKQRVDALATANAALEQRLAAANSQAGLLETRLADETAATKLQLSERLRGEFGNMASDLAQLANSVASLRSDLPGKVDSASIDALRADLATRLSGISADLALVQGRLNPPRLKLAEALRFFSIFFTGTETLENEVAIRGRIAQLVPAIRAAGGVRVVGYSDQTGTQAVNLSVSRRRAEIVAQLLREAGVEAQQIVLSSRATMQPLSDPGDPLSPRNRHVTLEALLENELVP